MNRKYDNRSVFLFQKAISFKTAAVIVVSLHLIGFFGIAQWSAYKTKLAREKRHEEYSKRMELAKSEKCSWPEGKAKIVATSPIPKPTSPTSSTTNNQSQFSGLFNKLLSFFSFNDKKSSMKFANAGNEDSQKDKAREKKIEEIESLLKQATDQLSKKAKNLAALEIALKEKQRRIQEKEKKQQTTMTVTQASKTKNPHDVKNYTTSNQTKSSPTIISSETARTYVKNGMHYVDIEETSKILSSHIVLQ